MGGFSGVIGRLDNLHAETLNSALALPATRGPAYGTRGDWFAVRAYRRHQEAAWEFGEEWIALLYGYVAAIAGEGAPARPSISQHESAKALLDLFLEYGPRAFSWVRGQWSLVLIDRSGQRVLFSRDYPGTRPLYWRRGVQRIWFSTEPGPLWEVDGGWTPNLRQLAAYARAETPVDQTVVEEVRRIEPGCVAWTSLVEAASSNREPIAVAHNHWKPCLAPPGRRGPESAAPQLLEVLSTAVRRAMPSGPFGVAFSGGVDSTLVLALAANHAGPGADGLILPLSLRFPNNPGCDEGRFAGPVVRVLGLTPVDVNVSGALSLQDLRELYGHIHTPAFPNLPLIARVYSKAAGQELPVVLTGMGGDHLLDGHPVALVDLIGSGQWSKGFSLATRIWIDGALWSPRLAKYLLRGILAFLLPEPSLRPNPLDPDNQVYPPHTLEKQTILSALDRESRQYHFDAQAELSEEIGVEVRDPLFDRDLIDLVLALEPGTLMQEGARRGLARDCLDELLPTGTTAREGKTDFTVVSAAVWEEWYRAEFGSIKARSYWTGLLDLRIEHCAHEGGLLRDAVTLEVFAESRFS